MKKQLLYISTIFPSTVANKHATYSIQQLYALKKFFDIDVINPIPWNQKIANNISYRDSIDGIEIYRPTYWYTPLILRHYYGLFYYLSVKSCAARLIKERGYDVVHSSWLYPDGWAASKIAAAFGLPVTVKAMGTDANRLVKGSIIAAHTVEVISRAKKILCVSEALKNKLVSIGADPGKIVVLYNGVSRDIFHRMDKTIVRNELGFTPGDTLILFVGNFLRTKGLDELADALANITKDGYLANVKLLMVGSGTYESEFKERLKAAGIFERTVFMGSCTLPVVARMMNAVDVVCLPSYSEGLPNVVLEAICCNAKVVATDVGGVPELKANHRNLYLVPPKDSKKLAEMLVTALNAECYEDRAEDIYSWEENADRFASIINE